MTYSCNLDFETRATVDLTAVGSHVYARHRQTSVLCAQYSFDHGKTLRPWRTWAGEKLPKDLHDALRDPDCIFEAWNASFERLICKHVLGIEVPIERWHCTMARARSMALPGKLELCARALHVPQQKMDNTVMMKWCKPLKNGGWADDATEYAELVEYCGGDVRAEAGIGAVVRPMSAGEWLDYHINERINDRGVPVDLALAAAAQNYAADELADIRAQLSILTKGAIDSPKQFQRIKTWLDENLPEELKLQPDDNGKVSFDAAAREELLSDDNAHLITGDVREFVELVHDGGRASTAKFAAMLARGVNEQRVYGAYVFNGAGQTGRLSSQGIQLHNMVRDKLANIDAVVEAILRRVSREELQDIASYKPDGTFVFEKDEQLTKPYNVLTILSRTLRPSIVADEGKCLVWGDWKSIEAVMLPWLSKENSASELLDYFASGKDIYIRQAMLTYGLSSVEQVTKQQRQVGGKVTCLSFGFGGGAGAIMRMARAYNTPMDEQTAETLKEAWRESNPWGPRFWKALERAAFQAVRKPGEVFWAGRVAYLFADNVLWCLLPCGRMLAYPFAKLSLRDGRQGPKWVVTAMKGSFHPKKGTSHWPRMDLWGGFQAENCLSSDTEVLTSTGWKRIVEVSTHDWLWDGVEWVRHKGLVQKGRRYVENFGGVDMTSDHRVLVGTKMQEARYVRHDEATTTSQRLNWPTVWPVDSSPIRWSFAMESSVAGEVHLRGKEEDSWSGPYERIDAQLRMPAGRNEIETSNTWYDQSPGVLGLEIDARSMSLEDASRLEEVWRARDQGLSSMAQIRDFLARHGFELSTWLNPRENGQLERVQPDKLSVGDANSASAEHTGKPLHRHTVRAYVAYRGGEIERHRLRNIGVSCGSRLADVRPVRSAFVYDLMDAGPRHRFAIRGLDGRPFIVHNCTQAGAASVLRWARRELFVNDWFQIGDTHDELLLEVEEDEVDEAKAVLKDIMTGGFPWTAGLPLLADIDSGIVYGK